MRRVLVLLTAALAASGCTQDKGQQRADPVETSGGAGAGAVAPGTITVRGGERFQVEGTAVLVEQVTYLNQPCPPDARCFHSGIIKLVHFELTRDGTPHKAAVPEGARQVVAGVELAVKQVRAGPEADIELRPSAP
jgi:hypothetical protein